MMNAIKALSTQIGSLSTQMVQMTEKQKCMEKDMLGASKFSNDTTDALDGIREDWVVEEIINEALEKQKVWVHPNTGKRESSVQAEARMIFNEMLIVSLRKFPGFYSDVVEGDNYQIIRNVIGQGSANSRAMVLQLKGELSNLKKTKAMRFG